MGGWLGRWQWHLQGLCATLLCVKCPGDAEIIPSMILPSEDQVTREDFFYHSSTML